MSRNNKIIYLIIASIVAFCLITINLFIYFKDLNVLYEDRLKIVNDSYLRYPYFQNDKDAHITEYLNVIDTNIVDEVKYLVNYLGDYTNIIFRSIKEDMVVDYYSVLFDSDNNISDINDIISNKEELNNKVGLYLEHNKINLTIDEYNYAKKSYLFKDNELEIYVSSYNEEGTISLITLNYWELKSKIEFPHKLDKKYELMKEIEKEDNTVIPIIPDDDINTKKLISFTFDDGPSNYTLELLDVLNQFNANATFFLTGYNIKIRNSVVLDMYNRGFEIGNHTIDHSRLTRFNCEKISEKLERNNEIVKNITDFDMKLVRPPYGAVDDKTLACISYPAILWSVDSRDWESRNTEMIVTEVLSNIKEGDVVLFHDLYPTTIEAIKVLLPILYADNYKVVSVSELFEAKNIILENHKTYRKAS